MRMTFIVSGDVDEFADSGRKFDPLTPTVAIWV